MAEWTHLICEECWFKREGQRIPVTMSGYPPEPCCFCGVTTESGIYTRHDPSKLDCKH